MAKGKAHNTKNHDFALIKRRAEIAELYCKGKSQHEIAEAVNASVATVSKDLAAIREYWLALMAADFDQVKSEQLAKIDLVEKTAWRAWRRSTRPVQTRHVSVERGVRVTQQKDKNGQPIKGRAPIPKMMPIREVDETTERGQAGDPRFLTTITDCIDRRLKLLGLLDDKSTTNVYLDLGTLIQQRTVTGPHTDPIEDAIAQIGHNQSATIIDQFSNSNSEVGREGQGT